MAVRIRTFIMGIVAGLRNCAAGAVLLGTTSGIVAADNYALQFDGTDDFARVIDTGNFDFSTHFTIEAWIKADSVAGSGVARGLVSGRTADQPDSGGGWVTYLPASDHSQWGASVCTPVCESRESPPTSLVAGEWHHVAAVYDGALITLYQDGTAIGNTPHSGDVTDVSYLFLGAWSGTFDGLMDEIRIWNIARTHQEILSTVFVELQGNEAGLVGYWPLNDGNGQYATDATGQGQSARLGSLDAADAQDPAWVVSDAPIIPPTFQLVPPLGGLGTDIGITTIFSNSVFRCGWVPGETIEIWWDKPEAKLAVFTADGKGCFEGIFRLDDSERIPGSEPGAHKVEARGSFTGIVDVPFEQLVPQLHLNPSSGPSEKELSVSGCGWDGATRVNVMWQATSTSLGQLDVDHLGCIAGVLTIPRSKDGLYSLLALSNAGPASAAAYWARGANIQLTPNEGPPGARVPLAGHNWFPEEQIDFAFTDNGIIFATRGTGLSGSITTNGPTEPILLIPNDAALGARVIRATGRDSLQVVDTPFTVMEPTLVFNPENGYPGDPVEVSGCGWVGNSLVTVEWGYPDTNSLPIRWSKAVETATGCFGQAGDFVINVPANTNTGPVIQTATGDQNGEAIASFTVNHNGRIEIPSPDGYVGSAMTVNIFDAIVGESITFRWDVGHAFDGVGAATPDFSYDITLPLYASVGTFPVRAEGTKGFDSQVNVNILDNSEISVATAGVLVAGTSVRVEGSGWAAGEFIRFELRESSNRWPIAEKITVATDQTAFSDLITLPADLPAGLYTLIATGNKGREAETSSDISVVQPVSPAFSLQASYADPPPDLDGQLSTGEWDYGKRINLANGFLTARSDDSRLYILLDLLTDTGNDTPGQDNFWLTFDIWKNQQIDPGFDLNFRLDSNGDMILEEYSGPNHFNPRNSTYLRSAYGSGFGCFFSDGSLSLNISRFIPLITCNKHRVWEIAIDLATLGVQPGSSVRVGVRTESQVPAIAENLPAGFPSDFSELGVISLASSQLDPSPPAGVVTGIGANGFEIEVTQAIQDAANSLGLVADKDTVARVYPGVHGEALTRVFLFGEKDGQDLPGSPLVTLATVPPAIDREALGHTANFLLPKSWTGEGALKLTGIVENLDGQNSHAYQESVSFRERRVPEIWVFPFNEGTEATPLLPTHADMLDQEQVLERLLPTPSVKFVRRPWTETGVEAGQINFSDMKNALSERWKLLLHARIKSGNPDSMPDMLYGFKVGRDPKAVGTSDPVYSGGKGRVVVGQADGSDFNSTTMIHEVNHNLDRSRSGTWGRHVADPDNVESKSWGCGADGPDAAWPYNGTDNIQEVGFDPILPWTDGAGEHLSVVPTTRDDFMSYCWKKGTPIQWISPYRWQAMYSAFTPVAPAAPATSLLAQSIYYLSGELSNPDIGISGSLDPVQVLPGDAVVAVLSGDYSIEVQDAAGATLFTMPFLVSFVDVEGVVLDTAYFNFQIPEKPNTALILLKYQDQVLDSIVVSANPPLVQVDAPGNGENWSGMETISWTASDLDGDELTFSIFYSPDAGGNWYPVVSNLDGNEYSVDTSRLPGGSGGKILVVASDGFHTVEAFSDGTFTLLNSDFEVVINAPEAGQSFYSNERIRLSGGLRETPVEGDGGYVYVWSVNDEVVEMETDAEVLLPRGEHTVMLSIYDGEGNHSGASVDISVKAVPRPDDQICFPVLAPSGKIPVICF